MVQAAELVCDGMDIAHVGAREGDAGVSGRQSHLLPRLQVLAVAVGRAQVLEDQPHRRKRHAVGGGRGPVADEGLDRVGQCVDAGGCGDMRRQAGHQAGVERRHLGHEAGVDDDDLAVVCRVRDHRRHGHFRAGACGGGHGVDRDRRAQALEVARQLAQRLAGIGDRHGDGLGGVDRRAATDRHDGVALVLLVEVDAALDQGDWRIGRDLVEHHVAGTAGAEGIGQVLEQPQFDDDGVGDDQYLRVAEACDGLPQAPAGPRPHQQLGLGNGQKPDHQAGSLHQGRETSGAC